MQPRTKRNGVLGCALVALAACSHTPPARVEAPNWLSWGRKMGGARVSYPEEAWRGGVQGTTESEVCVDETGKVTALQPVSGHKLLQSAALQALATWTFEPVRQGGRAVPACFRRRFSFRTRPAPEDFYRTEGEMTVTRGYEPPRVEYRPPVKVPGSGGEVYVRVCVGADGTLDDLVVMQGLDSNVDARVTESMHGWRFKPATLNGVAIPACQIQRVALEAG